MSHICFVAIPLIMKPCLVQTFQGSGVAHPFMLSMDLIGWQTADVQIDLGSTSGSLMIMKMLSLTVFLVALKAKRYFFNNYQIKNLHKQLRYSSKDQQNVTGRCKKM